MCKKNITYLHLKKTLSLCRLIVCSTNVVTRIFFMYFLIFRSSDGRIISVSDHEPLASTFLIHDLRKILLLVLSRNRNNIIEYQLLREIV